MAKTEIFSKEQLDEVNKMTEAFNQLEAVVLRLEKIGVNIELKVCIDFRDT